MQQRKSLFGVLHHRFIQAVLYRKVEGAVIAFQVDVPHASAEVVRELTWRPGALCERRGRRDGQGENKKQVGEMRHPSAQK